MGHQLLLSGEHKAGWAEPVMGPGFGIVPGSWGGSLLLHPMLLWLQSCPFLVSVW